MSSKTSKTKKKTLIPPKYSKRRLQSNQALKKFMLSNKKGGSNKNKGGSRFGLSRKKSNVRNVKDTIVSVKEATLEISSVNWLAVFRYAHPCDYVLMFLGLIFCLISSALLPILVFRYGQFYVLAELVRQDSCEDHAQQNIVLIELRRPFMRYFTVALVFCAFSAHALFMMASSNQALYLDSILQKDFTWFDTYIDRNLTLRMTNDITEIRSGMTECLPSIVIAVTSSVLLLMLSFYSSPYISLVGLVLVPLGSFVSYLKTKSEIYLISQQQEAYKKADSVALRILSDIYTIKEYQGEEKELIRYKAALCSRFQLWKSVLFGSTSCALLIFLPMASRSLLFYLSVKYFYPDSKHYSPCLHKGWDIWDIQQSPIIFGLVTSITCCSLASILLATVPVYVKRLRRSHRIAAEVFFTIDWRTHLNSLSNEGEIPRQKAVGKLQMFNVVFEYPRNPFFNVLRNVSLAVYPGQIITLFGPPGSGKSTVLKLLLRLYDPKSGKVRLDGIEVVNLNVGWVRSQFGVIPQEIDLLNTTVEENIRFGKLGASFSQIVDVCQRVQVHEDILNLPDGYNTVVGTQSTVKLSKSLVKRISLARVVLQSPRIMLLDDFITELDGAFEAFLLEFIQTLRDKCTVVMTTSKFNPIVKHCDNIFAMLEGRIVEAGTHDYMMSTKGNYFKLLEDALENTAMIKLYFYTQLQNYKFAEAITRKHKFHDDQEQLDFNAVLSHKRLLRSVLLRHVANENRPLVTTRLLGCFHPFCNYSYNNSDMSYLKWLVRNNLLRERDLRQQLLPLLRGLDTYAKYASSPSNFMETDQLARIVASETNITGDNKRNPENFGDELRKESSLVLATIQKMAPSSHHSAGTPPDGPSVSGIGTIDSRPSLKFTNLEESSTTSSALSVLDEQLQHYFGWTVNSSVDNESIDSEDSYFFWDQYNLNLVLSMIRKWRVVTGAKGFFRLAKYSWPFLGLISLTAFMYGSVLSTIAASTSTAMQTAVLEKSIPTVIEHAENFLFIGLLIMLVYFILEIILGFGIPYVSNSMSVDLFYYFLKQPFDYFGLPENDIEFLRDSLASDPRTTQIALFTFCSVVFQMIGVLCGMTWILVRADTYRPEVAVMAVLIILFLIVNAVEGRLRARYHFMIVAALKPTSDVIFEVVTNIRMIQLLRLEELFSNRHREILRRCYRTRVRFLTMFRSLSYSLSMSSFYALFLLLLSQASSRFEKLILDLTPHDPLQLEDDQAVYQFILLVEMVSYCISPIAYSIAALPNCQEIGFSSSTYQTVHQSYMRQKKLNLLKKPVILGPMDPIPTLMMKDVVFTWTSSMSPGLRGITAVFPPGRFVAIVGDKKSGKATLIKLLLNLVAPMKGSVFMNEVAYTEIEEKSLRKIIGSVQQDPDFMELFTIAQNIAYGDNTRTVSMVEIEEAARFALIHEFVEQLEKKYETILEDLPQTPKTYIFRQKLSFAREVIHNPKILLVDQANLSLNEASTKVLWDLSMKMRAGRTMVMSAHRVEPVRSADIIYFVEDGIFKETGTHDSLVAAKGAYYEFYFSQRLFEMNQKKSTDSARKSRSRASYLHPKSRSK